MKWLTSRNLWPVPEAPITPAQGTPDTAVLEALEGRYYAYRFELGDSPPPENAQSVLERFQEAMEAGDLVRYIPRLPSVLPRLIRLLRDNNADVGVLVDHLVQDPTLVARVLSLANSPYFRRTELPIGDLQMAVVYLGADGLRALVHAAVMQPILRVPDGPFRRFSAELYGQALATAALGQALAGDADHDASFQHLCGLLHATGEVSILAYAVKHLDSADPALEQLAAMLSTQYARQLTARTAVAWKLGDELENILIHVCDPIQPASMDCTFACQIRAAAQARLLFAAGEIDQEEGETYMVGLGLPPVTLKVVA